MPVFTRPDIYENIVRTPYHSGYRLAKVVTGYASSSFIYHVIHEFPELELEVVIGMAKYSGVSKWDHLEFVRIAQTTHRLTLSYYLGRPPIHTKGVLWKNGSSTLAYAGSSNFSWHGYRDFQELMTSVDPDLLIKSFPQSALIECRNPAVLSSGLLIDAGEARAFKSVMDIALTKEMVELPLFVERGGRMHERSGLNWGQRPEYNREANQAYIPVPKSIHDTHPTFFPPTGEEFTLLTDDGESFLCVMAQDNRKAIETRYDNSTLGRYFRRRLGLSLGVNVRLTDLEAYGRKTVTIYKISEELFYLDYSS